MQELRILKWCDVCHKESGAYVEALQAFVVRIQTSGKQGAGLTRKLEACEPHAKLVTELYATLKDCGTQPDEVPRTTEQPALFASRPKPEAEPEVVGCRLCSSPVQRQGMLKHLINMHGAKPRKTPTKCPDCGGKYAAPQGMAAHRRVVHGWDALEEAYAALWEEGKR
jgi:hypothetical protein